MFTDALPLCFPMEDLTCGPQSLLMSAVLHPCSDCGFETCLSLVLDAKSALCVEGAVMDVVELPWAGPQISRRSPKEVFPL